MSHIETENIPVVVIRRVPSASRQKLYKTEDNEQKIRTITFLLYKPNEDHNKP